ncbi:MAG: CpaF family protein [Chloroflexi bacterium]|nr:CpaF family protein [Chloroflexota bacterium]
MTNMSSNEPLPVDLSKLKTHLITTISRTAESNPPPPLEYKRVLGQYLEQAYQTTKLQLSAPTKEQLFREVMDELTGYGPLQPLLNDPEISEIMVNGAKKIYVERKGKITRTDVTFDDDFHVLRIIDRIILPLGRRIDVDNPTVDARLPDGSRVNAAIPPVAIDGPSITIRKFMKDKLSFRQLIELGSITENMVELLRACVIGRLNLLISGGTGSGKTTLLNILSGFIPDHERIITIEDAAELQLQQEHVVRLETKPPNVDGKYGVATRDLVRNTLRMRPDRIIVGECRGGEALDMLQAMNTGHDGSLTTIHANSPRDAISRLETLTMMAGMDLPFRVVRSQIASAIDVVIQTSRLNDGSRKVTAINEISGMEGETVTMSEIFKFQKTGVDQNGKVIGELKATGIRPFFTEKLLAAGFKLGPEVFGAGSGAFSNNRKR